LNNKYKSWERNLDIPENKYIISDAFWYAVCLFHEEDQGIDDSDSSDEEPVTNFNAGYNTDGTDEEGEQTPVQYKRK